MILNLIMQSKIKAYYPHRVFPAKKYKNYQLKLYGLIWEKNLYGF